MKVVFAADHAGYELKNALLAYVRDELGYEVEDLGPATLDPDDDYPVYIYRAAKWIAGDSSLRAIILGGSGQGEAMCANRIKGVRAAVYYGGPMDIVRLSREHNDANILSLGARFVDADTAKAAISLWLSTPAFAEDRYQRREAMMDNLDDIKD